MINNVVITELDRDYFYFNCDVEYTIINFDKTRGKGRANLQKIKLPIKFFEEFKNNHKPKILVTEICL